ncbi:adenosine deaminase [Caldivirga maquilingensis]|uniref:Adenosine deaminase n=1 Tax=Caldivirga maquilingensis (strain ATCC 700844 / DSM 13496 / JCM 10307 / IC-167) TaxID=397948 RepID=A8M9X5_CALMQ|nr:adenosine deaminase [Caldivirga maquilingensis]ABW02446.1 adenosine deaminase [Caldivirga maquilingensis IC-167]
MGIVDFLRVMPKAELHVHIEGTLEPEMIMSKAEENGVKIPYRSVGGIRNAYRFNDLQSFLNIYYSGMSVLVDRDDFRDLALAYFKRAHQDGVRRAEVFFDPQAHLRRGVNLSDVILGLHDAAAWAMENLRMSIDYIMCLLRDLPEDDGISVLQEALKYRGGVGDGWIIGICLDSKEYGNPPSKFRNAYRIAVDNGLIPVAHAGEEAPAEYVWEAINVLNARRIDHGYHAFEDESLIKLIAEKGIPVNMCPLTTLRIKYFNSILDVPVKRALDAGIAVTINSDDPAYFGGYILDNYIAVYEGQGLRLIDMVKLAENSIRASFLKDSDKDRLLRELVNLTSINSLDSLMG